VIAAAGFAGVTVVFAMEMSSFRASVLEWAVADLFSRTEIAVSTLREPLRTGDFAAIHAFSRQCAADDVRLSVFGKPKGGLVFDSLGGFNDRARDSGYIYGPMQDAGAFEVMLGLPEKRVFAPFKRAQLVFLLAALVGATGMFFVFFALYRQRVRIHELARIERFRREFVADVSHEIKTPLTGILGAVDMLEGGGGGDDAMRPRLLAMVSKESKRLNTLVQQILDLARLEREGDVLDMAETDLAELVRDVIASLSTAAESAGVRVVATLPDAPVVAKVDARLVAEAVSNLIGNAIRHSGSPEVFVALARAGEHAEISVEDHGVGIPAAEAERVFERFHRVDPARAAESGGAGLGLAIVRRIARLHGGDVTLRAVHPHGCRFVLRIA